MNTSILKEFGLTETEIKIYITLLEEGESLASYISKKAYVERAVTYHILEKLIRKGIVSYVIKENRKYFSAAEPEKLKDLLREKEQILDELIPELSKLKKSKEHPLSIEVFNGENGFKTIMDDLIRNKKSYYIIGYTGKSPEISNFWYIHWNKRRVKNKIKRYLLINKGSEKIEALKYPLTETKVLPSTIFNESKSSIIIYGNDKVALFLPLEEFSGIRIINKETHDSYKHYFEALWKIAKK
ncbi:MAG: helix-turn-helix domain-containing protein [Nanoarchaeota archaeon]